MLNSYIFLTISALSLKYTKDRLSSDKPNQLGQADIFFMRRPALHLPLSRSIHQAYCAEALTFSGRFLHAPA
jgi:hypothetical protein